MKSPREIGLSFPHPNRLLTLKGMGDPRIRVREALAYALVFALVALTVAGILRWHIASLYQHEMASWRARLSSMADDQAQRVSDWLRERQEDAQVLANGPSVRALLRPYHGAGQLPKYPPGSLSRLTAVLNNLARFYPYAGVYVLDRDAQVIAQSSRSLPWDSSLNEICRAVTRSGAVRIDLVGGASPRSLVVFAVPVFPEPATTDAGRPTGQPLGIVLLVSDASRTLFPLLTREFVPTRTSETVFVRREGNDIVCFSPLPHVPRGSPPLRCPFSTARNPARLALEGRETFAESKDYRGTPVLVATQHIPVTGWGLVRKIDRAEALEDFRRMALTEELAAGLLIFLLAGGLLLFHRREVLTRVLKQEEEKFRALLESAPDAIYIMEPYALRILTRNRKAAEMDGYSDEEIAHMSATDLHPSEERNSLAERLRSISEPSVALPVYALHHRRKDGHVVPIEERQTLVEAGGERVVLSIVRDITERKRTEDALKESEERFRAIVENAPFGYYRVGKDGLWQYVNPVWERMHGLSSEEIIGKPFEITQPPDSVGEAGELVKRALAGEAMVGEFGRLTREGNTEYHSFNIQPVKHCTEIIGIEGFINDITERKRAEEALRDSEEKHRTLFESMAQGVVYQNADGQIISANPAAERLLGLTLAQMLGRTSTDPRWKAIHEDGSDFPGDTHPAMIALKTGKEVSHVVMGVFHPGANEYVWINIHAVPQFRRGETKPYQVYTTFDDITQRKRAEEGLRESEQFNREVIANVQEGVAVYDREFRCQLWNRFMEELSGVPASEALGKCAFDLFPHLREQKLDRMIRRALAGEVVHTPDTPFLVPTTGKSGWVSNTYSPHFGARGEIIGVIGTVRDITERKRAEEAVRRASAYNRSLIEASLDPLVTIAPDGKISDVNNATEKVTGLSRQQLLGTDFSDYFSDSGKARAGYEQVFREGLVQDYELEIRHRDGHVTPVLYNASVYRDEAGVVIGVFAAARDISERKRAEESRAYLASIVESSDDAIVGESPEGVIRSWNRGAERLYGYAASEVLGQSVLLLVPPERQEELAGLLRRIRQGEAIEHHETTRVTKGGRRIDVSVSISPLKSAGGEVVGASTIARDITERKRVDAALRQVNAYNRSLIEASLDPLVTIAPDGKITDVNNATEKVTGLSRQQLIGTDFSDYFTDPGKARAGYEQVFREGLVQDYELEIRRRDGHVTPVLYNASVYRDEAGDVIGVFAAARDTTERKRTEEALRQSDQRYKDFISHSSEGVWRLGLEQPVPIDLPEEEGFQRLLQYGYTAECNLAHARNFGYSTPEEVVGMRIRDKVLPSDQGRLESIRAVVRGGWQTRTVEFRGLDKAGKPKDFLRTDIPIVENGMVVHIWGITRDITERKQAEEARQRSLEQLRALAARLQSVREEERKRVARDIHDELGQALTALKINLSSLILDLPADKKQQAEPILKLVGETIHSVRRISTELRPAVLDAVGLVAAVEWAAGEFEARTGIKCRLDLPPDDIVIDQECATAVFRIFQETLTNVARHANAAAVDVRLAKEDGSLTLEARDNGKGVSEEQLLAGSSLGILGMRERALLLGGELTITGALGKGTTLRVRIPRIHPTPPKDAR
jgi:PAS domain S-box-containing protein